MAQTLVAHNFEVNPSRMEIEIQYFPLSLSLYLCLTIKNKDYISFSLFSQNMNRKISSRTPHDFKVHKFTIKYAEYMILTCTCVKYVCRYAVMIIEYKRLQLLYKVV